MHKQLYEVPATFAVRARYRKEDYEQAYAESIRDPEGFWGRMGQRIDWVQPYTKVKDVSFDAHDFHIRWYYDGKLNVSYNCLDRHLAARRHWSGDFVGEL